MLFTRAVGALERMRPSLYMAAALAVGIAAADWLRPHPAVVLVAFCALPFMLRRGSAVGLLVAVALFGSLRFAWVQTAGRGSLAAWEGDRVTLAGTVVSEPELKTGGGVGYIVAAERPAAGRVYVLQRGGRAPGYGERVEVPGKLARPAGPRVPGGFDQAAYLARQGVYLTVESGPAVLKGPGDLDPLRRAAVWVRIRLEGVLRQALPPREAALMAGLLFGSRSELPDDIKEAFRSAGVFHLLAVSGGNVAMLVVPLLWLLCRAGLRKRAASGAAIPVVLFFVFLTGATPSVMRAGLMAMLVLLGDVLGRERDALQTLGVAVCILLAGWPALLFDLGFQLSAAATLGILLLARRIEGYLTPRLKRLFGDRLGGWLAAGLAVTFAAQALVEPISLHHFGTLSLVAPLANLLVLLVVGWLVPGGLIATVLGAFGLPVGLLLRLGAGVGATVLIYAVKAMATLPLALVEVDRLPAVWVVAWYAALPLLAVPSIRQKMLDGARRSWRASTRHHRLAAAAGLLVLVAASAAWRSALADPPDHLVVTFLDVGQGDATLIQAPGGRTMLIDAGQAYPARNGRPAYDTGAQVVVPYLQRQGISQLDYLVLTHPDGDHVGGAPSVLQAVAVGELWLTAPEAPELGQVGAIAGARQRGVPIRLPMEGEQVDLGGGVWLEILGPPVEPFRGSRSDDNANCIAMRLTYRQVRMLLACDLEAIAEERLVEIGRPLRADLLKVSHHGSHHSSTPGFLRAVQPAYAMLSAGAANPFGHPHAQTLERLAEVGAQVWRTDRQGTVVARTDGFALRLSASRSADETYRPLALMGRRLFGAW